MGEEALRQPVTACHLRFSSRPPPARKTRPSRGKKPPQQGISALPPGREEGRTSLKVRLFGMATPTAPAVQPQSEPATASAQPAPSALANLFSPVEPARGPGPDARSPLGSTAALPQPAAGQDGPSGTSDGAKKSRPATPDGPVSALVRAIATRLARTGTATTIKRQHTVTETRVSGNQSTSTSASKNDRLHKNDQQHRTAKDAKLADLNNKASQARSNQDVKKADTSDAKTSDAKAAKNDTSAKTNRDDRGSRDAKTSDAHVSKSDTSAKSSTDDKNHDVKSAGTSETKRPDGPSAAVKDPKPVSPDRPDKAKADGAKAGEPKTLKPDSSTTTDPAKPSGKKSDEPKVDPAKANGGKPDNGTEPSTPEKPGGPNKPHASTPRAAQRPHTQTSREAGYRDGTRAAAAVGHVKAWRDGTRDGWDDRTAADNADRRRMDANRDHNALRSADPARPQMTPVSGSTVDLERKDSMPTANPDPAVPEGQASVPPRPTTAPTIPAQTTSPAAKTPAVPAQVTAVGDKAVQFTADGAAHSLSRREVRTLKGFERRMGDKKPTMQRIAEAAKSAAAEAAENANRAQQLADGAKGAKAGEALARAASRLAEQAQLLRSKAEEINKRASRAHESIDAVITNAETRHGGIYKAVVDSPLTAPAERYFYEDKQGN